MAPHPAQSVGRMESTSYPDTEKKAVYGSFLLYKTRYKIPEIDPSRNGGNPALCPALCVYRKLDSN
jgi:hypothetical protein